MILLLTYVNIVCFTIWPSVWSDYNGNQDNITISFGSDLYTNQSFHLNLLVWGHLFFGYMLTILWLEKLHLKAIIIIKTYVKDLKTDSHMCISSAWTIHICALQSIGSIHICAYWLTYVNSFLTYVNRCWCEPRGIYVRSMHILCIAHLVKIRYRNKHDSLKS